MFKFKLCSYIVQILSFKFKLYSKYVQFSANFVHNLFKSRAVKSAIFTLCSNFVHPIISNSYFVQTLFKPSSMCSGLNCFKNQVQTLFKHCSKFELCGVYPFSSVVKYKRWLDRFKVKLFQCPSTVKFFEFLSGLGDCCCAAPPIGNW